MYKKGQVTIFIVVGIVILLAVASVWFLISSNETMKAEREKAQIDAARGMSSSITPYVESCLHTVAQQGTHFIATRGGHFNLPPEFFNEFPPTAFYIYNDQKLVPTLEDVGTELSTYIDAQLQYCLDFTSFTNYVIETESPHADTTITENTITVTLSLPTTIQKGESTATIEKYKVSLLENRLGTAILVANTIVDEIVKDPEMLCFSCIFNVASSHDFDVLIDSYDQSTYLFQLQDLSENDAYIFTFAIQLEEVNA